MLAFRAGLNDGAMTAGTGIEFGLHRFVFVLDYAFTDDEISERGLHFISIGLDF